MSAGDKVRLSVRERQQLAAIQAMVEAGDPELAKTLTGQRGLFKAAFRQAKWLVCLWARAGLERKWVGPLFFVLGFALMLATISLSPWISVVGALLVAGGLGLSIFRWQRRRDLGASRRPVGQSVGD
jgi:Flp pilus assembly protein TadB